MHLAAFNVLAVLVLSGMSAAYLGYRRADNVGFVGHIGAALHLIGAIATAAWPATGEVVRYLAHRRIRAGNSLPIVRGIAIATPIVLVFGALLYRADSLFASLLRQVADAALPTSGWRVAWDIGDTLVWAWALAGLLLVAVRHRQDPPNQETATAALVRLPFHLGAVEVTIVLGSVNALFLLFVGNQIVNLLTSNAVTTLDFEAYRTYARTGYGELIAASILTMVLIACLRGSTETSTPAIERRFRLLASGTIALALVLLGAAMQRFVAWEEVEFYILTPVRIFVWWSVVWLALLLGWCLYSLWQPRRQFAFGVLMTAIGLLATLNIVDLDASVAAYNLRRNDDLSVRFLRQLSDDAVPTLVSGLDTLTGVPRDRLRQDLRERLARHESADQQRFLPRTLARERARNELIAARESGRLE
jgi:hypothetical protein